MELLQALDAPQGRYAGLARYHSGDQPLAFISPESRKALGNRLTRMGSNIPKLAISSMTERLKITGLGDQRAWRLFVQSDLDQLAVQAMTDSLLYGTGFILVWQRNGRPVASVESPRECAVLRDPADRSVIAGVKRWRTKTETHAMVYLPDRLEHHVAKSPGAATAGFEITETLNNPLGVVPLVPIDNGSSEIDDIIPLVDALNKLLVDMMTASEAAGKPRRWISGLELAERPRVDDDGNPIVDDDGKPLIDFVSPIDDVNTIQTMISEEEGTRFGQLPATDLSGFKEGVQVILSQLQAVSALPSHYVGILTSQPNSADALRASEASLTARCEQKQLLFGRAFEQVGRLLVAVESGTDPADTPVRIRWASASSTGISLLADAYLKLASGGLVSKRTALAALGMTDDEIEAELELIKRDAQVARDILYGRYMSDVMTDPS